MDPTMNFLTAPTAAPRGGDLPSPGAGTDSGPQSSEFAGVLNGQMLKLERQALASAAPPAAGLQVVPLGNKLSVITTDAPLPDMATLADFARAQGLGETAVQALFGATGPKPDVATLHKLAQRDDLHPTLFPTLSRMLEHKDCKGGTRCLGR